MGLRDWLSIVVIVGIALVILDGFRRKWLERKRSLKIKLDKNIPADEVYEEEDEPNHELPNGGARPISNDTQAPYFGSINEEEDDVPVLMDSVNEGDLDTEFDAFSEEDNMTEQAEEIDEFEEPLSEEFVSEPDEPDEVDVAEEIYEEKSNEEESNEEALEATTATDEFIDALDDNFLTDRERLEPTFGNELDDLAAYEEEPMVAENRTQIKAEKVPLTYTKEDQTELFVDQFEEADEDKPAAPAEPEEVLVINVVAKVDQHFSGQMLLPILTKQGLRLGEMSIFHRHSDVNGNGPVMFSMANLVKPGTFDITKMEDFSTPGISFFLQLPNASGNMESFEQMLKAAEAVKNELGGDLKDEQRNVITRQTLEHSRERIRDFELKQLSNK